MIPCRMRLLPLALLLALFLLMTRAAWASSTLTVAVGPYPVAAAVNPITNKIYIVNACYSSSRGSVTVIDGATNSTVSIAAGKYPMAVDLNTATNKIYVANAGDGSVTVIDGASRSTATVAVGNYPMAVAVNSAANKIYVANAGDNTVTVIDGASNSTTLVRTGSYPFAMAVNAATNKTYVGNMLSNNVTVIDGTDFSTTTVTVGTEPGAVAVNPATNIIYVANGATMGTVSVIDGLTNAVSTIGVGSDPGAIAVNPTINVVYVSNHYSNSATVIDGEDNSTATVLTGTGPGAIAVNTDANAAYVANSESGTLTAIVGPSNSVTNIQVGQYPRAVAVNPLTGKVYVVNYSDGTVTVVIPPNANGLRLVPITPCRVVDTRKPNGTFGGPPIAAQSSRDFPLRSGACGIPANTAAYSLNVTVVPRGPLGYLTVWPAGSARPSTSTLNSTDGRIKANASIVPAGTSGAISVYASNPTDVVLDINGYFVSATVNSALAFYPLTPCRIADTRKGTGALQGPYLKAGLARDLPILSSACDLPDTAQAYSLNFTAVPRGPLGYLTAWPSDRAKPSASTLNALTGTITANAALVPAAANGNISVYANNDTDLVIDIDGYFAAVDSAPGGQSFYTLPPCRVLDTRNTSGLFSGKRVVDISASTCGAPSGAQAFVLNATVVPPGALGYLILWPDGSVQPTVSTLNALDGAITSNLALVPAADGFVDAFASGRTQLVLDIFGYFAP